MGRRRSIIVFIIVGLIAGFIYPIFGDSHENYIRLLNGVVSGFIGSVAIALLEVFYFEPHWRNRNFILTLVTKSILYVGVLAVVVVTVKTFNESIYFNQSFWAYLNGENMHHFLFEEDFEIILLYALIIIGVVIFFNQLNRKMGPRVLWNLIIGKYHKPKTESIVLMNIDLKSSTRITEQIGAEKYHKFINRFYQDISGSILSRKGQVYRYVGDQITVYWNEYYGLKKKNCIKFYLEIKKLTANMTDKYKKDFGYYPEFRACCHMDELAVGQIGDVKSQIVFHGEALYACEMIEKKCKELNEDFLVSGNVASGIVLNKKYRFKPMGALGLKHVKDCEVYRLEKIE